MVFLVFQTLGGSAHPPNTGANEYNHAFYRNGGVATASGSSGSNTPNKAIDGNENGTSTYWQSSTTTGWLAVAFPAKAYVDEIHAHFLTTTYARLSLYLDTSGNGAYETAEKVWTTTSNPSLDVVIPRPTSFTLGMKLTIDAKVGNNKPMIAEFEAYLRTDTDGDGLTNDVESGTVYFYQSAAIGLPLGVPDVGSNNTTLTVNRLAGVPFRGLADFTVDHGLKDQLSATLSYWDGGAWVEVPVWDPGRWLTRPRILYPTAGLLLAGVVPVRASVNRTSLVTSVEFFVDGVSKNSTSVPSGNEYLWSWNTAGYSSGTHVLRARSHDAWSAYTDAEVSVLVDSGPPVVSITASETIVCPQEVTISGSAQDVSGLDRVTFLGVLHDLSGPASWSDSQSVWVEQTSSFTITAVDMLGNSASASVTVRVPQQCFPEGPGGSEAAASIPAIRPDDGFFLSPGSVTITAGTGKTSTEAGYSVVGSSHRVVVNLTNPPSGMTAAERSGRIAAPGLPPDVLNRDQVWRLTITDWASGIQGSITAFSVRIEETTSLATRDTDSDGLPDGRETRSLGTSPIAQDTDVDGLTDDYEVTGHSLTLWNGGTSSVVTGLTTDPIRWDTDTDGLADGQERGFVTTGQSKVIGEVGRVTGVTTSCTGAGVVRVFLRNRYTSPVVLAEPPTRADAAKGVVRVLAVTDHTFDVCFQEWQGDSVHTAEAVDYFVVEAGDHVLADGSLVEAGSASVGTAAVSVTFREPFADAPLVLAQTQSFANPGTTEARIKDVFGTGFTARLRTPSGSGVAESVGYVAVSPQADPNVLATWSRGAVGSNAGATSGTITFPKPFASTPRLLAWFATENGAVDVGLRLSALTNVSASYVRDATGTTSAETIHYFAFAQSMNLTARTTTRPNGTGSADTDGDGLADGIEVNAYGSNPGLKDTDADGIADNVEVAPRTITIPVNGTAKTITFMTSPTSDDTDADGVKDPDELAGVLDHRILFYDMETTLADGRMRDWSGNGGPGTLSGTTSVAGKVGNARSFAPSNYLQVADAPVLSAGVITVAAWVYVSSSAGTYNPIVAKGQSGVDFQYYMDVRKVGSAWKLNVQVKNAAGTAASATSSGSILAITWTQVAFTFDGSTVRLYVNGAADSTTASLTGSLRTTSHPLRIGHYYGSTLYFTGSIDEVQLWDRALSVDEIAQYAAADLPAVRFDMESLRSDGKLADFSGKGNAGTVFAASLGEGRIGFGRSFAAVASSVNVTDSASMNFNTAGLTLAVYVLAPSAPASDVSLVAKRGEFYLNLSSDGLVRFTLYGRTPLVSVLPLPLNRWVRVSATSDATTTSLYVDDALVATASGAKPADTTNALTLGRAEGCPTACPRFLGSLDEVVIYAKGLVQATLTKSSARGILLNPNATDTDFDGLADGQELLVRSVKTPKRTPLSDQHWTFSDPMTFPSVGPAWAVGSAMLAIGVTHPDMGQIEARFLDNAPAPYGRDVVLRAYANAGEANNFTSYDLVNLGYPRDELVLGGPWYAYVYDRTAGLRGQIEYAQIQLTIRTLPNRADTDMDGLNDSEEVNLGSDGFATNPWVADTDADGVADGLESNGWSRSGGTILADPNGFKTDPTRSDTDHDGVADSRDYVPLGDAFITVTIVSATVYGGTDDDATPNALEPFVEVSYNASFAYTAWGSAASGGTVAFGHTYSANVADDVRYASVYFWVNDYDSDDIHDTFAINGTNGFAVAAQDLSLGVGRTSYANFTGSGSLRTAPLRVTITTVVPDRIDARFVLPADYAGVYNVTNAAGATVSRRYVGEPRFVALALNVTTPASWQCLIGGGCDDSSVEPKVLLLPRSVFFESRLYAKLAAQDLSGLPSGLAFRQNSTTAASNSDGLQEILSGNVTSSEYLTVLDLLLRNATNAYVHVTLNLTNDLFLYGLPDEAVRLVGYRPLPSTPSVLYRFCATPNCATNPVDKPIWERIWEGLVSTVTSWIVSAVVMAYNAFRAIVEILAQVGAWFSQNIVEPVKQAVASAVQAAAKALLSFFDWVGQWLADMIRGAIDYLTSTLEGDMRELVGRVQSLGTGPAIPGASVPLLLLPLGAFLWNVKQKLEDTFTVMEAAESTISVVLMATGIGGALKTILSKIAIESVKKALQKVVIAMTIGAIVQDLMGLSNEQAVESFAGQVFGVSAGIAATVLAIIDLLEDVFEKRGSAPRSKYAMAVSWALLGLSIELLAVPLLDAAFGTSTGMPLLVLDVVAAATTVVSLLILGGKTIFKTGMFSAVIDRLVEFFGPITSETEQILTGVSATSTFVSIGVHVASGDYWK